MATFEFKLTTDRQQSKTLQFSLRTLLLVCALIGAVAGLVIMDYRARVKASQCGSCLFSMKFSLKGLAHTSDALTQERRALIEGIVKHHESEDVGLSAQIRNNAEKLEQLEKDLGSSGSFVAGKNAEIAHRVAGIRQGLRQVADRLVPAEAETGKNADAMIMEINSRFSERDKSLNGDISKLQDYCHDLEALNGRQ